MLIGVQGKLYKSLIINMLHLIQWRCLHTLSVFGAQFSDIDISPDGKIALGTGFNGEVVVTDLALDSFTRFRVTDTDGINTFVAWATPVPEPSTLTLLVLGSIGLAWRLARRDARGR